jgi:acyl-CoA reductase-like NAD-dependent aldehyde dehydrogenase
LSKVAFTGSTATGRQIAISAARNLIPHSNELGGKSAILVFEDADLKNAVEWVMVRIIVPSHTILYFS